MVRILTIFVLFEWLPAFAQSPVSATEKKSDSGYYSAGQAAFSAGRFDEAINQEQRDLDEAMQKKDMDQVFQALTGMFSVYRQKGEYDESFSFARQLYDIAEKSGKKYWLAASFWCLAQSYSLGNDYADALTYYRRAWAVAGRAISKDRISRETGVRFLLEFAETFSRLQQRDSAAYYYGMVQPDNDADRTLYRISIGETQYRQGDFQQAMQSYMLALASQHTGVNEQTRLLLDLSSAFLALGNNLSALQYARSGLNLAFSIHVNQYIRDGYQLLSEGFGRLDRTDSSDHYFRKYSIVKEGILNEQIRGKFAAWQFEQEIARVKREDQELARRKSLEMGLLLIGILSLGGIGLAWLRIIQLRKRNELLQKTNELEMMALRARLNPHFIFNCLNSINRFIIGHEAKKGADYLTKFARLMRMVLERSAESYTLLQDELDALRLYIDLEKLRFEKTFVCEMDTGSVDTNAVMIPSLLLQPFVENAIWHGLQPSKDRPGKIDIRLRQEAHGLRCEIRDNGIGINKSRYAIIDSGAGKKGSMGIELTRRRLQLTSPFKNDPEAVQVYDLSDENGSEGTLVVLLIPAKTI